MKDCFSKKDRLIMLAFLIIISVSVLIPFLMRKNIEPTKYSSDLHVSSGAGEIKGYLEGCNISKKEIFIYGWAALDNGLLNIKREFFFQDESGSYYKIKNNSVVRIDVLNAMGGNRWFLRSGFESSGYLGDLKPNGKVAIKIENKNGQSVAIYECK